MHEEVPLRITVTQPPRGVAWAVQSGRGELILPRDHTEGGWAAGGLPEAPNPRAGLPIVAAPQGARAVS